jgi:hypothetical protein
MISLKTHNIMDYIIAATLVITPFLFNFSAISEAQNVFLILGFGLAAYSLLTKYFYSAAKLIPLGVHMILDAGAGLMVLLAPYLFNYRNQITNIQFAWHLILGLGAFILVGITRTRSEKDKTPQERRLTSSHVSSRHHA